MSSDGCYGNFIGEKMKRDIKMKHFLAGGRYNIAYADRIISDKIGKHVDIRSNIEPPVILDLYFANRALK
jgi:hypothetical protein